MEEKKEADEKKKSRFQEVKVQKTGVVDSIGNGWIFLSVNGLGEKIRYNEKIHSELKKGDTISL